MAVQRLSKRQILKAVKAYNGVMLHEFHLDYFTRHSQADVVKFYREKNNRTGEHYYACSNEWYKESLRDLMENR